MIESPRIAIIGGTGLSSLTGMQMFDSEWPGTPYGEPTAPMVHTLLGGEKIIFFTRHGEGQSFPPHRVNYRANLHALKQAGVEQIVAVNAVGGISAEMTPRHICIPDQLIDYTFGREATYFDGIKKEVRFVDFSQPFDPGLRDKLIAAASDLGLPFSAQGVYGCTQGPRLETAAEINRMERDGCHIVGMTAYPEAVLAKELEIPYASICLVANRAAGRAAPGDGPAEAALHLEQGMAVVEKLLRATVGQL